MNVYTPIHIAFLREGYKHLAIADLTIAFNEYFKSNKSEVQIKSTLTSHKITSGRSVGNTSGVSLLFSLEQTYFIKELYTSMTVAEVAAALNNHYGGSFTAAQIKSFVKNHGVLSGRTGCFEQGIKPWNTGTKGLMKVNSGSFKKGDRPANEKTLGSERICPKDDYVLIKVAEKNPYTKAKTRYKHKHIVIWEQLHGPVPNGHVVTFVDGDKRNFDPSNLRLIDRNLLCRFNKAKVNDLPTELIPTMKNIVELNVRIQQVERDGVRS